MKILQVHAGNGRLFTAVMLDSYTSHYTIIVNKQLQHAPSPVWLC